METPSARTYDSMTADKPGLEMPSDPRPIGIDAIRARIRAIREGRLMAPPRDEVESANREAGRVMAEKEAAEAAAQTPAKGRKKAK